MAMRKNARNRLWGILWLAVLVGLAVWITIPQHPSISWGRFQRDLNVKLGLDLQGGSHLVYRADLEETKIEDPSEALAGVRDVIERRVNAFGISEPNVQTNRVGDEFRVIVELAGVHDPEEAIKLIGATPQLDFRTETPPTEDTEIEADNVQDIQNILGAGFERTSLTGAQLETARVDFDQVSGAAHVSLKFDDEGAQLFAQLTEENIGKRIGIFLDGALVQAPVVQSAISNGEAVITGYANLEEAKLVARNLNAGALPVPIELIGQQSIGPTLGRLSIDQSVRAGLIGLLAVIVWMIAYYRLPGVVAAVALVVYAALFLSLIKLIPITLTLAGVAGLILSIGMAVDANVLIFERFRENLRAGKTSDYALKDGFAQAWNSIKASNVSSLITGVILYGFGTSIVRGFALTFSIGIILSMFTAVTVTRMLLSSLLAVPVFQKPFLLGASARKPTA